MVVLIKSGDETCDSKCYNAEGPDCQCACGGRNHGKGLDKAIENTKEMVDKGELEGVQLSFNIDEPIAAGAGTVYFIGEVERMEYQVPFNNTVARCDIEVFIEVGGRCIVKISERGDNPGMSITNAMEYVIARLMSMKRTAPHPNLPEFLVPKESSEIIFIEHYPDRHPPGQETESTYNEDFAVVNYKFNDKFGAESIGWTYLPKEDYLELVKDWKS